jgi:hypothetical protein
MQTFMVESTWQDLGVVETDLRFSDGALVGSVRNRTATTLYDAAVILGSDFVRLGDLEPGGETEVRLDQASTDVPVFGPPIGYRLFEEELQQPRPGGPPRDVQLKQQILDATFSSGRFSPISSVRPTVSGSGTQGLTLIAWLDRAPPRVRVAGRQPAQRTTALYVLPLEVGLPESGPISVPAGLVESRVVQMPVEGGPCGSNGVPAVYINRGSAVFEFRLGESLQDVQVEQLRLHLRSGEGGWRQAPAVAIYDWPDQEWAELREPDFGDNLISGAEPLVSAEGMVRVRLIVEDPGAGACYLVGVGFEGYR